MRNLGKFFRFFLGFSVFILVLSSNYVWSNIQEEPIGSPQEERVYINPDQIEITDYGIFARDIGRKKIVLVESLGFDKKGLYFKPMIEQRGPCGIHRAWCKICGGCGVLLCPMNCTCFD